MLMTVWNSRNSFIPSGMQNAIDTLGDSLKVFFFLNKTKYILKRWQEYTEEMYKKDLHDPDNHDGVTARHPGM